MLIMKQLSHWNTPMKTSRILLTALFITQASCTSAPTQPDLTTGLAPCGSYPNCVNSDSGVGVHAIEPLQASPAQWESLKVWIKEQKDWRISKDEDLFLQAVAITPWMRYREDIQLLYQTETRLIQVRSSSRLGYSDMGANRTRVEHLRGELERLQQ